MTNTYTGILRKQPDGTLQWTLEDKFGWPISGTAMPDRDGQGAFYRLSGTLGPTPEHSRLPGEDEMGRPG